MFSLLLQPLFSPVKRVLTWVVHALVNVDKNGGGDCTCAHVCPLFHFCCTVV
jgi:hypothetical protein